MPDMDDNRHSSGGRVNKLGGKVLSLGRCQRHPFASAAADEEAVDTARQQMFD
jgi:hypothetical protein